MAPKTSFKGPMKAWPSISQYQQRIHLPPSGLEVFYYGAGNPAHPALIMIHGLGDEADTWRHVFEPLSENFHTIALDLPGFGRSDKQDRRYTPKFFKDSIYKLLDMLEISKGIMMGSSLGGILSHAIALEDPKRVTRLVLVDGALLQIKPMQDWSMRLMQVPLLGEWLYTRLRNDPQAAFESLRNVYHDLDKLPEPDRDFLFKRVNERVWSDGQRRAYFSTLRNLTPWVKKQQSNLEERLSNISIPTLVIRGEYDELFPEENALGVAEIQPTATAVTIQNAGHLPHQENPKKFLEVLGNWLID